jgi:predicted nuclease of restriction endonuclease-like (RecB) superfamily
MAKLWFPFYKTLVQTISEQIYSARVRSWTTVDSERVMLYWTIGKQIRRFQEQPAWNDRALKYLSKDLRRLFPTMQKLSARSLKQMIEFAKMQSDEQTVREVFAQLPWSHNLALLEKIDEAPVQVSYARQAIQNGWDRNTLALKIYSRPSQSGSYAENESRVRILLLLRSVVRRLFSVINPPVCQLVRKITTLFGTAYAPKSELEKQRLEDPDSEAFIRPQAPLLFCSLRFGHFRAFLSDRESRRHQSYLKNVRRSF